MLRSRSDSSSEMIFNGVRFVLFGFDTASKAQYRSELVRRGGIDVGRYDSNVTHVIVSGLVDDDPVCVVAREDEKVIVTELWIDDSVDFGVLADASRILYCPVKDLNGIPGSESLYICLTGYQRQDRDDIMKMVSLMGAQFSKPLIANKVTHLICYKFEGEKYDLAKKVKIKLVNHRWLEDCLKAWEILPIDNYTRSGWELEILEAEARDSEEETDDPETELLGQRNNKGKAPIASSAHLHTPSKEISMTHNAISNPNMQLNKETSATNKFFDPTYNDDAISSDAHPKKSFDISPKNTTHDLDTSKLGESSNQTNINSIEKSSIFLSDIGLSSRKQDERCSKLSYSKTSLKGVTKEIQNPCVGDSKENTTNGHQDIPITELETNNSLSHPKRKASDSTTVSKAPKLFPKQSPSTNISQLEPASLMSKSHVKTNNQFEGSAEANPKDKQYPTLSKFSLSYNKSLKLGQTAPETKNSRSLDLSATQSEHLAQPIEPMQLDNKLPASETVSFPDIEEEVALSDNEDLEKLGINHCKEKAIETFNVLGELDLTDKSKNDDDITTNDISKSISDGLTEHENISKSLSPNGKDSEIRKLSGDSENEPANIEPRPVTKSRSPDNEDTEIVNFNKNTADVHTKKVVSRRNLKSKISKNTSSTDSAKILDEAATSTVQTKEVVLDKIIGPQSPSKSITPNKDLAVSSSIKSLDVCTEKAASRKKLSRKSKLSSNASSTENANMSDEVTTMVVDNKKVVSDVITEPQSLSTSTSLNTKEIGTKKTVSKRKLSSKSELSTSTSISENANISDEATATIVDNKKVVLDVITEPQSMSTSSLNSKDIGTKKTVSKRNLSGKSRLSTNTSIPENATIPDEATITAVHDKKLVSDVNIEPQSISTSTSLNTKDIGAKKLVSKRNLSSKSKLSTKPSVTENDNISDEATTITVHNKKAVSDVITEPQLISTSASLNSKNIGTKKTISKRSLSSKSKLATIPSFTDSTNVSDEATTITVHNNKAVSDVVTEPQFISTSASLNSKEIGTKKTISKRNLSSKSKLSTNPSVTENDNISDEATTITVHKKKAVSDVVTEPQFITTSASLNSKDIGTKKTISKRNLRGKSKLSTIPSGTDNTNISDEATTSTKVEVNTGKLGKRKGRSVSEKSTDKGNKQVADDATVEDKSESKENKSKKKFAKKIDASMDPEKENKPKENGDMPSHVDSHPSSKNSKHKGEGTISSKNNEKKATSHARLTEPEPAWFLLSGSRFQRKEFHRIIKELKGRACRDSHNWNYQATHFIVPDRVRRTEKLFAAAAAGRWILKSDYLTASKEAGKFLAEEPYEWYGKGLTEDCSISLEAPRKWRQLRERTGHGAFYKMQIVIYGECIAPSLETLKRAVKAGDGTILATSPPYTRSLNTRTDLAIISPGMTRADKWVQEFLSHQIPCVAADYVVEYVCKPGHSLDRHVLFNTGPWAERSLANLHKFSEEVAVEEGNDDDISCSVCGSGDRGEVMLVCECGAGMHIDCCDPPLEGVPEGDWFCPGCRKEETPKRKKKAGLKKK